MIFPLEKNIVIPQGYAGELDAFWVPGDYTSHELYFEAKTSKSLSADTVIQKANAAAGGSDTVLASVLDGVHTKITPLLYYSDLQTNTTETLYYQLVAENASERVILYKGKITVLFAVIADADAITYSLNLAKRWVFKLTPPDTIADVLTAANFSGTLSASVSGDVITITSTEEEFTESFQVTKTTGVSIGYYVDANTYKINLIPAWDTDYSYVIIDFYKLTGA